MNRIGEILFTLALVLPATPFVSSAEAQNFVTVNGARIGGDCIHEYNLYENDDLHKAFAVSRNGTACGYSYGYDSVRDAETRALAECRTRGRNCRVIASY